MFSSDERAVRVAELQALGDRGTIARLRSAIADAAEIMVRMADALEKAPAGADWKPFAVELRRGARAMRGLRKHSRAEGTR